MSTSATPSAGIPIPRVATHRDRLAVVIGANVLDASDASGGRFGPDPLSAYENWDDFVDWLGTLDDAGVPVVPGEIGTPVPRPSQIFAIGLNYADHADEAKMEVPEHPVVFTKFGSSLAGPDVDVALSGSSVDWEAELVVVLGRGGRDIPVSAAWDHVAGLAIGQDISDRTVQSRGAPAQFSLGKSFAGFAPVGPVVPLALLEPGLDRDALAVTTILHRESETDRVLQDGTTADMIFPVTEIIARLSQVVELRPGDLIFTGTPSGVGLGRDPQEYLLAGDVLTTRISGLGSIVQRFR